MRLYNSSTYIIINSMSELQKAKRCRLCSHIILEKGNTIFLWEGACGDWELYKYSFFESIKDTDIDTTGLKAYKQFYAAVGREKIDIMKSYYKEIPIFESFEQLHYANIDFVSQKMYQDFYEFDANSAFTYGTLQLPSEFNPLKNYMLELYNKKSNAPNQILKSRYKNLQNYLIGYFARVKGLVSVRSNIIKNSNNNILDCMSEIFAVGGKVYLSNTDSIITDKVGADVMQKHLGKDVGKFKLEKVANKLYYEGSNYYQLGDKKVHSGVKWFAKKHEDIFKDISAVQKGELIQGYDFYLYEDNNNLYKLCKVKYGKIIVDVFNFLGELIDTIIYKIGE